MSSDRAMVAIAPTRQRLKVDDGLHHPETSACLHHSTGRSKQLMIASFAANVLAIALVGLGIILVPLPLPLGALMILLGTGLAITVNPAMKARVRRLRRNNPRLEAVIRRVRPLLPSFLRKPIEDSAP
ncbi:MAG: hypothetical protein AAGG11_14900 [Pseudomonadota bacterium]